MFLQRACFAGQLRENSGNPLRQSYRFLISAVEVEHGACDESFVVLCEIELGVNHFRKETRFGFREQGDGTAACHLSDQLIALKGNNDCSAWLNVIGADVLRQYSRRNGNLLPCDE